MVLRLWKAHRLRAAELVVLLMLGLWAASLPAQTGAPPARSSSGADCALIVVGLPGDVEHEALFRETAQAWRRWLTGPLKFPAEDVRILFGAAGDRELAQGPATREAIASEADRIRSKLAPERRLWVFFLGHANYREGHAYFHLPGPDLREDEYGTLFEGLRCREQVFWMTTPASGAFLPVLSAKGRIVITASQGEQESNETEFPHALAQVSRMPPEELDRNADGRVTVWELFVRTTEAVVSRFQADQRAPTEHALLDDNGDGVGTEWPERSSRPARAGEPKDGTLAQQTVIKYPPLKGWPCGSRALATPETAG
jgi:hypothetical protein